MDQNIRRSRGAVSGPGYREPDDQAGIIVALSAAVRRSKANSHHSTEDADLFMGWNALGDPIVVNDADSLSKSASESYRAIRLSRFPIPEIPYRDVIPVEYYSTDSITDLTDQPNRRIEDILNYSVRDPRDLLRDKHYGDSAEKTKGVSVTEYTILSAIAKGTVTWQVTGELSFGGNIVKSSLMYSTLVPLDKRMDTAMGFLFKPSSENASNEVVFKTFIAQTIAKLLVLEFQNPKEQKGYTRAVQQYLAKEADMAQDGQVPSAGIFDILYLLEDIGIIGLDKKWFSGLAANRGFIDRLVYLLNTWGESMEKKGRDGEEKNDQLEMVDPSSINTLSVASLLKLVSILQNIAYNAFH